MCIDKTTAQAERGEFTWLSVEIYLTKPLLSNFSLRGKIWKIQYERLQMICFNCGCWGNNSKECPTIADEIHAAEHNLEIDGANQGHNDVNHMGDKL